MLPGTIIDLARRFLRFAPYLPVEFIDTAGCGFLEVAIPESRSTANPDEAHLLHGAVFDGVF